MCRLKSAERASYYLSRQLHCGGQKVGLPRSQSLRATQEPINYSKGYVVFMCGEGQA